MLCVRAGITRVLCRTILLGLVLLGGATACGTPCLHSDRQREAWLTSNAVELYPWRTRILSNPVAGNDTVPWGNLTPPWANVVLSNRAAGTLFCTQEIRLGVETENGWEVYLPQAHGNLIEFDVAAPDWRGEQRVRYLLFPASLSSAAWQSGWHEGRFGWQVTRAIPRLAPLQAISLAARQSFDLASPEDRQELFARLPKMFGGYDFATLPPQSWIRRGQLEFGAVAFDNGQTSRYMAMLPSGLADRSLTQLSATMPTALFIHGLRACKESWIAAMTVFAVFGIPSLAVDLPDHGERAFPDGFVCGLSEPFGFWQGFSPADIARNLERSAREQSALVTWLHRKGEQVTVVAHSLGTMVASRIATTHRTARFVLAAPTGDISELFATFVPDFGNLTNPMVRRQAAYVLFPFDMRSIPVGPHLLVQLMGADATLGIKASKAALTQMGVSVMPPWTPREGRSGSFYSRSYFSKTHRWADLLAGADHLAPLIPRKFGNENILLAMEAAAFAGSGIPWLDPASPLANWLASGLTLPNEP